MFSQNKPPIVFIAIANDQLSKDKHLPGLREERDELNKILLNAKAKGLCEVIVKSVEKAEHIFEVFTNSELYRDRIAIFHFAGHANSLEMILESGAIDVEYFSKFLGEQKGLKLLFLNGCSTYGQVEKYFRNNVQNVIATSSLIYDELAKDFAIKFYHSLAGGTSLVRAFNEASSITQSIKSKKRRDDVVLNEKQKTGFLPWKFRSRPGAEESKYWSLPEAVNNPLFGLPELPQKILPTCPFPNLKWFTEKHAEIFFGRGQEIRRLYMQITDVKSAPIVLLYGQSGVGKSSLLEAGLLPRLRQEQTVQYERRDLKKGIGENFIQAFSSELPKKIKTYWIKEEKNNVFTFILDQVEGIITNPIHSNHHERKMLVSLLNHCFNDDDKSIKGKFVLSLRKEHLADFESLLQEYNLNYTKVFIQSLNRKGIIEAVSGIYNSERLKNHYGLDINPELPKEIAYDLVNGTAPASIAPTLQILLFKLWQKAIKANPDNPIFALEAYYEIKTEGLWLTDFLKQQLKKITPKYQDNGLALDLLKFHVSTFESPQQRSQLEIKERYKHVPKDTIELLEQLKDNYLLLDVHGDTRLAHDTLAPIIYNRFNESNAIGQRAIRILESRELSNYPEEEWSLLSSKDLAIVNEGKSGMRHPSSLEELLIKNSDKSISRKKWRNRILLFLSVITIAILFTIFRFWQLEKKLVAEKSLEFDAVSKALIAKKLVAQNPDNLWPAFKRSKEAFLLDSNLQTMNALIDLNQFLPLKIFNSELGAKPQKNIEIEKDTLNTDFWIVKHYGIVWGKIKFPLGNPFLLKKENLLIDISIDNSFVLVYFKQEKEGFIWQRDNVQAIYFFKLKFNPKLISFSEDASAFIITDKLGNSQVWARWQKKTLNNEIVEAVAISPSDTIITAGGKKGILKFWTKEGELIRTLNTNQGNINQITFLANESNNFIVASDKGVRLWEYNDGSYKSERIDNFRNKNSKEAIPVKGNHSTNYFLIVERFGSVNVYNSKNKEIITEVGASKNYLTHSAAHTGKRPTIATAHADQILRLWDWESQILFDSIRFKETINAIEFSPDGTELLIACSDKNAYLFNLNSDQKLSTQKPMVLYHFGPVNEAHFSHDGNWIVTASSDHTVRIWNRKGEWLTSFVFDHIILDAFYSENGDKIIVLDNHNKCQIILIDPHRIIDQFEQAYHTFKPNKDEDI